jgi:hypothetical protein
MSASAGIRGVSRAVLCVVASAVLLASCGGGGDKTASAPTATTAARAACTKPQLTTALRRLGTARTVAVERLQCAGGYALTTVREGQRRSVVLWQDAAGSWSQVARDVAGACPEQAAAQKLCRPPKADPALRRCTRAAFLSALRADVDKVRFRLDRIRCSGGFARTRFAFVACLPGQTGDRRGCERTREAAWRRDARRWRLITFAQKLDCPVVQAAAPRYPAALCGADAYR